MHHLSSLVYTIYFNWIVKQAIFAYVNHARIRPWNQPVLSNERKVSCSRKQRVPLMRLELTTERYPPITSQTCYPLHHAATYLWCILFKRTKRNKNKL